MVQPEQIPLLYKTQGYNPQVLSGSVIQTSIVADLLPQFPKNEIKNKIAEIYFYGAGCSTIEGQQVVHEALEGCFPQAAIYVYSDMLAAVRAACGHQAGVCAILGAGSNS